MTCVTRGVSRERIFLRRKTTHRPEHQRIRWQAELRAQCPFFLNRSGTEPGAIHAVGNGSSVALRDAEVIAGKRGFVARYRDCCPEASEQPFDRVEEARFQPAGRVHGHSMRAAVVEDAFLQAAERETAHERSRIGTMRVNDIRLGGADQRAQPDQR